MDHAGELLAVLRRAVAEFCDEAAVGVLFSGGLDSTVIARLASERCHVCLYTMGMPGSHDIAVGRETADELGLDWKGIVLTGERLWLSLPHLASVLGTESPLVLSFEMPLYAVAQEATESLLVSGQGADELFGGYARYARMGEEELSASLAKDLEGLRTVGAGREVELARHFGKTIRHPFLHDGVVRLAKGLPLNERIRDGERKKVLRDVAALLELREVATRPKKAAQYGSGVMKAMKSEAKRRGVPLTELVRSLRDGETL